MSQFLYRYRPIEAVLDKFHELENQEIYFSAVEELNDPVEGFKDLVWSGDEIVWRNLLKHYILCVLETTLFVADETFDPKILQRIVFQVPGTLPDAPIREVYARLSAQFLAEPAVRRFVELMSARTTPVRRMELTNYLRSLHGFAMQIVISEFQARGLFAPPTAGPAAPSPEKLRHNAIAVMEAAQKMTPLKLANGNMSPEIATEAFFEAGENTTEQVMLIAEINFADRDKRLATAFLANRFASAYVSAIEKLVHRDWYVACFAAVPDDHSMWSTYGGGHRGAALMFKPTQRVDGTPTLRIECVTGAGAAVGKPITYSKSEVAHEISAVRYSTEYPVIDFFRSLGTISNSHLNGFWYLGEDGKMSVCHSAVYGNEGVWRGAYWKTFEEGALYKTPEWQHEKEQRIVVHSGFDMEAKEKRKLKYRFDDLAGIVFGAKTDFEDKLKILRIIERKCALTGRTDFKFFQVRYLPTQSRFHLFEMGLLKCEYPLKAGA